jgi:hypothetical protein
MNTAKLVSLTRSIAADVSGDDHLTLDLRQGQTYKFMGLEANIYFRGTRFTLSRDELLTLPEFVLLSLFPNGLLPDGHMNSFHEGDVYPVDVRPLVKGSCFLSY